MRPTSVVLAALKRVNPKGPCEACRGAGCTACNFFGFVPTDPVLIHPNKQAVFEFPPVPAPWEAGGDE